MKTEKGTIELKMRGENVTVKCTWIGPVAIHKQYIGTTQFKDYAISNTEGLRILALDGWRLKDIVPMVDECLQLMEVENLSLTVTNGDEHSRLHTIFKNTAVKHLRLKSYAKN